MNHVKRLATGTLVTIAALVVAELFLRLVVPQEIALGLWYSFGIHRPDDTYGYVFTPDYRGFMYHIDGVTGVPLRLDSHGYRLPAGDGNRKVVLVGGVSMMFNYGLPDSKTIHAEIARQLGNATVYNTAWPGWGAYRNWQLYLARQEPNFHPDVVVLSFYSRFGRDFFDYGESLTAPPREKLFRFRPDMVLTSGGELAQAIGPAYYRSYIGYRLVTIADKLIRKLRREPRSRAAPKPWDLKRFDAFLRDVENHLKRRGIRLLVAFLPGINRRPEFYKPLTDRIPEGVMWVDLHRRLIGRIHARDWIAGNHYGARAAKLIGRELSLHIKDLLE